MMTDSLYLRSCWQQRKTKLWYKYVHLYERSDTNHKAWKSQWRLGTPSELYFLTAPCRRCDAATSNRKMPQCVTGTPLGITHPCGCNISYFIIYQSNARRKKKYV
jgi:hypothetical protein